MQYCLFVKPKTKYKQLATWIYAVEFGETEVKLGGLEVKSLVTQVTKSWVQRISGS